jgi:hypothetical protein
LLLASTTVVVAYCLESFYASCHCPLTDLGGAELEVPLHTLDSSRPKCPCRQSKPKCHCTGQTREQHGIVKPPSTSWWPIVHHVDKRLLQVDHILVDTPRKIPCAFPFWSAPCDIIGCSRHGSHSKWSISAPRVVPKLLGIHCPGRCPDFVWCLLGKHARKRRHAGFYWR